MLVCTRIGKIVRVCIAIVAASLLVMPRPATIEAGDPQSVKVRAVVNGTELPIAPGTKIGKGVLREDGTCDMPSVKLVGSGSSARGRFDAKIVVETTSLCEIVVKEVDLQLEAPTAVPAKPAAQALGETSTLMTTEYEMWAISTYNDVVGLDLTKVHTAMHYSDDGSTVGDGHARTAYCDRFPDGWYCESCNDEWYPWGPNYVYNWTEGYFYYAGGNWRHYHDALVEAWPGDTWNTSCDQSGEPVPYGFWECTLHHDVSGW